MGLGRHLTKLVQEAHEKNAKLQRPATAAAVAAAPSQSKISNVYNIVEICNTEIIMTSRRAERVQNENEYKSCSADMMTLIVQWQRFIKIAKCH